MANGKQLRLFNDFSEITSQDDHSVDQSGFEDRFRDAPWWNVYFELRQAGWKWRHAAYIAWVTTPKNLRWPATLEEFAQDYLEVTSRVTRKWRLKNARLNQTIQELRQIRSRSIGFYRDDDKKVPVWIVPETCIYIMRCNEFWKIGISKHPEQRLEQIDKVNPYPVDLVDTFPVATRQEAMSIEASLHQRFAALSVKGEWFRLDEEHVETIRAELRQATLTGSYNQQSPHSETDGQE